LKAAINTVEIAYDDHGIGLPVIFLHAFPLDRSMWTDLTATLLKEQRYRLVALDWRGFGESTINNTVSTMELFADDVAGLMDTLGMRQAILCGLSMGGYAALAFLQKYPQRLSGLILADTRPGADTEDAKVNRERIARLAEMRGNGAIADLQLSKLISDDTHQYHPEVVARIRRMIATATPSGIAAASRGMAQRADLTHLLPTIPFPTLVVVGELDVITSPDVTQEYAAKIPGAQMVVIPRAGHLSNLEQPKNFFEVVRSFLATF
jgi:3-oxoadipate enol-lactonase